jgi:positive regulator of sigma E activity
MNNKVTHSFKFIMFRCICLAVVLYLTGYIAQFLPNIRSIRIIEAIIMLIITAISFYIIDRYERKAYKNKKY